MKIDIANLDVVQFPHPALRRVAKPIPKVTPLVQDVARRMIELMHEYRGIGLAATQIAIPWRMFVTCANGKELVFINPEIVLGRNKRDKNPKMVGENEACLSFPGLKIDEKLMRARDVYVEALDINGKPFTISGPGVLARVIQHENDHLNGVLFIDHLKLEGFIQWGEEIVTLKFFCDSWLNYIKTQYEYMTPPPRGKSEKPRYGTDEEEIAKLDALEKLLDEPQSEESAGTLEKVGGGTSTVEQGIVNTGIQ